MKAPKSIEDMNNLINEWIESAEGHDSLDREEMIFYSHSILSIIKFIEGK